MFTKTLGRAKTVSEGRAVVNSDDRFKHLVCIGGTGSGKTVFLLNLLEDTDAGIILIDPNGDLAARAYALYPDAVYVTKNNPISLNPLTRTYLTESEIANEFVDVLNTASKVAAPDQKDVSVLMAKIIRNAMRIGVREVTYLAKLLEYEHERRKVKDEYWQHFDDRHGNWYINREQVDSAKRVGARLSLMVDDQHLKPFVTGPNEFSVREIAQQKKVYIFNFYGFDTFLTSFLGGLVASHVASYYMHDVPKERPPLFFFADEASLFFNELYARFFAESRKYNISLNITLHGFSQVEPELASMIWANCHTKIFLGGDHVDATTFAKAANYKMPPLGKFEAVAVIGNKPHHIKLYPPLDIEPKQPPQKPPIVSVNFLRDAWITV